MDSENVCQNIYKITKYKNVCCSPFPTTLIMSTKLFHRPSRSFFISSSFNGRQIAWHRIIHNIACFWENRREKNVNSKPNKGACILYPFKVVKTSSWEHFRDGWCVPQVNILKQFIRVLFAGKGKAKRENFLPRDKFNDFKVTSGSVSKYGAHHLSLPNKPFVLIQFA